VRERETGSELSSNPRRLTNEIQLRPTDPGLFGPSAEVASPANQSERCTGHRPRRAPGLTDA